MRKRRWIGFMLVTTVLSAGCAGPRTVHLISSNPKQVKMLYYRNGGFLGIGAERGIVKCDFKSDTLDNCRDVAIEFSDEVSEEQAEE